MRKFCPKTTAFTLIEVALALAIFSTGLVILVGMIPQNLDNMRDASSESVRRRIAQNIIGELMQNEWVRLHLFDSKTQNHRYFDGQGIEMNEFTVDTIFTARVQIIPRDINVDYDRSLESGAISNRDHHDLPDDQNVKLSTSQHARRIIIELVDIPNADFDFDDPENARHILRVASIITNMNDVDF